MGVGEALLVPGPPQGQVKARKGLTSLPPGCLRCPERPERRCIVPFLPARVDQGLFPDLPALVPVVVDLVEGEVAPVDV